MARFDKTMAEKNAAPQVNGHSTTAVAKDESSISPVPNMEMSPAVSDQGQKRSADGEYPSDIMDMPSPKKKSKANHIIDADAAFAARLQAEENSRARPTRNGALRKTIVVKKKKKSPKKKTMDKIKPEDDSDLQDSGSDAVEKKVNRSGGFHVRNVKPYFFSSSLTPNAETNDAFGSSLSST